MAPVRKLQVGISGLGRMGARHALNFANRTPRADLVAAYTPDLKEVEWAATHLPTTKVYTSYEQMLQHPGLEAVVVACVTTAHADHAIKAIEAGKHVLCEKPLSTSVEIVS
jgi:myo-inositol 2-dehydrogenase / D-chiro-inositol 1-dehydrogenase